MTKNSHLRYCADDIIQFPLGNDWRIVHSKSSGKAQLIPTNLANLLFSCSDFKSVDEHVRVISLKNGNPSNEALRNLILQLVKLDLLISDQDVLKELSSRQQSDNEKSSISTVGIVTSNRHSSLRRCVESHLENFQKYGRKDECVVLDDSTLPGNRQAVIQMLQLLKDKYGTPIAYGGLEEKRRFIESLTSQFDLLPDVIEFALLDIDGYGNSIGANRNALFLHSVGELVFSTDDDVICQTVLPPEQETGIAIDSSNDYLHFYFFPDRESALRQAHFTEQDILGLHEEFLGKEMRRYFDGGRQKFDLDIDKMRPRFLSRLYASSPKILATLMGLIGDSGTPTPQPYMLLQGDSRKRLMDSYGFATRSRELLRFAHRRVITDNVWGFMTSSLAYDNRELLPPFMPVLRGQDSLFAVTLRECFTDACFAHLPWALLHSPPEERAYLPGSFRQGALQTSFVNLVAACISSQSFNPASLDGKSKLRLLGKHLMEIGSLLLPDFEELLRIHLYRAKCSYALALENQLRQYHREPSYWADDIEVYLDLLRKTIPQEKFIVPFELREKFGMEEARIRAQTLIFKFGQLLFMWNDIVEAAKSLRLQGRRLSCQL